MPRSITSRTTLDLLKDEARRWLKAIQADDAEARARFRRLHPQASAGPTLRDVQHALALEHGLPGWAALKAKLAQEAPLQRFARVADALVTAFATGEESAQRVVWDYFGHRRSLDAMRRYVRLALGRPETPPDPGDDRLTLDEARSLVARSQDYESWEALAAFAASLPPGAIPLSKAVTLFDATGTDARPVAARSRDWDEVIDVLRERRWPGLHASGQMTDAILERVAQLDHLTELDLEGSKGLTDDGLRHLARLPRLRHLNLMGCRITDRGLGVLRRLPALESLKLVWTPVTDAGLVHLSACRALRSVDLMGTPSGDGAIRALAGLSDLADFRSGDGVTDEGLALLHELPVFKTWHGGDPSMALLSPDARPNFLLLRGPFTDRGLAHLAGLDGLYALNVDDARLAVTGAGLAPLVTLPHLEWLAFDAKDESMPHIAALPHLRFLMCQDTVAGDEGFVALSRSATIEYIWGRRCHNLQRRGFTALAGMPALRHLSVSCLNVDDVGLSTLPRFPALRELMPMDVPDEGYRHIGRCTSLESLVLMYCRETTDVATGHLAPLPRLERYFASYTRITDRTPEILSGMSALAHVTFDSCAGLTHAGVAALARLPTLRELSVGGMPNVTREVVAAFGPGVQVHYTP